MHFMEIWWFLWKFGTFHYIFYRATYTFRYFFHPCVSPHFYSNINYSVDFQFLKKYWDHMPSPFQPLKKQTWNSSDIWLLRRFPLSEKNVLSCIKTPQIHQTAEVSEWWSSPVLVLQERDYFYVPSVIWLQNNVLTFPLC